MLRTIKRQGNRKPIKDITPTRWHVRKIIQHGDSAVIGIPADLIRHSRKWESEPFRWQVGDYVQVGMTPSGRLVVEYLGEVSREKGVVLDGEFEEFDPAPAVVRKPDRYEVARLRETEEILVKAKARKKVRR